MELVCAFLFRIYTVYAENRFSYVATQFKPGHGRSCRFRGCTVRTHVGLLILAV